jgi:transposase, IS5 family
MVDSKLPAGSVAAELCRILDSPEITALIAEIETTRWTGRPGYPIRALVGLALAKSLYQRATWTQIVALAEEHNGLREALGGEVPSVHACYRFTKKLIKYREVRDVCADRLLASHKKLRPEMGENIAIDGSAIHAYANGHKTVSRGGRERRPDEFSDHDASWGHQSATSTEGKGRSIYGYKLHMATDSATDLPIAWHMSTAAGSELRFAPSLLNQARRRGFTASTCAMDRGYDAEIIYKDFEDRDCRPIVPLRRTAGVKNGRHHPHECRHGKWVFAGTDYQRKAAKWRCPTGECESSHRWVPASRFHTLVPRTTDRWLKLKRGRSSVEREFGRLKNEYGLKPLRVRGLERVRLHADLTIIAKLASALTRTRAAPDTGVVPVATLVR